MKPAHMPIIEKKAILCHIVVDQILPDSQRGVLGRLDIEMRKEKYPEKILRLSLENPDDEKEFTRKLEEAMTQSWVKEYQASGYKVEFDIACHKQDLVEKMQKMNIPALAFAKEGTGDMIQVEGIILALRVLREGDRSTLINIYKMLTGKTFTASANDINELARMLFFTLPTRKVDTNIIGTINKLIEENIKSAA